jgi:hypothetical protein
MVFAVVSSFVSSASDGFEWGIVSAYTERPVALARGRAGWPRAARTDRPIP